MLDTQRPLESAKDLSNAAEREPEFCFQKLASLGSFYRLNIKFDATLFQQELKSSDLEWVHYNKAKNWSPRYGLSLTSLNGEVDGEIDLNSVLEWNKAHGTDYNELSFRAPTPYWSHFKSITSKIQNLAPFLGRSHLLRLDQGGMFPPHRDSYREGDHSFRLIAFFECGPGSLHLCVGGQNVSFETKFLYFMNTRQIHSLVSFQHNAFVLVLNVELSSTTMRFVFDNLTEK